MARSFPLAGLLRLRHLQQDQAASQLAAANARLRDSGKSLVQARTLLGESTAEVSDPATLQAVSAARASSRSMLAELQAAETLCRTEAEEAQLAFQQARAQAIGLEKLQGQHALSMAAEELRGEQVVLDEIASGTWHRGEAGR
ncbi:flagellar FliJ family protein [Arthrobacter sp. I2-34]|uniref:Flagellar FliJ protein n=1 Tax=Arthrobacter hankyongi TaxID=2904801 RepID=A0ABS9L4M5_9MICC|nr:flagellar FliJ family protein [Arthrobacter hankyongi]MCG2621634.1 flagellar FliJ family protein [Arthrobacter hankyongi]